MTDLTEYIEGLTGEEEPLLEVEPSFFFFLPGEGEDE